LRALVFLFVAVGSFVGFVIFLIVLAPLWLTHQPRPTAQQPIDFNHAIHVQTAGLQCDFCHRTTADSSSAGLPDVQQCMDCHQVVAPTNSEVEKLRQAWLQQQPVDWLRVHQLPDHVHFTHEAHIQAGVSCATCHGDVGNMAHVTQVRALNMSDCVSCHQQNNAPTECGACHY